MSLSAAAVGSRLKTQGGRDFTLAVMDAFTLLGFEVEDVEKTQGTQAQSDLIVKAHLATRPYFAVLECTAVRDGHQVDYTKLYQLGSNAPRYLARYGKDYPSASYKMLVGRPDFSQDAKNLAQDISLLKADTLEDILFLNETFFLSQDDLERVFQGKGEISVKDAIRGSWGTYRLRAIVCALVYLALLTDPTDKKIRRRKEWTSIESLSAVVSQWLWLLQDLKLPNIELYIVKAVNDLSSTIARALIIDGQKVMISSLPFEKVVENMGQFGAFFKEDLMESMNKIEKLKQVSKV